MGRHIKAVVYGVRAFRSPVLRGTCIYVTCFGDGGRAGEERRPGGGGVEVCGGV